MSRQQAVGAALAVAWLNPHALVETLVLIGTASLAWGTPGNTVFGMGAATGSTVWFVGLGVGALVLGQRLQSPTLWRALDGLVAVMMWARQACWPTDCCKQMLLFLMSKIGATSAG